MQARPCVVVCCGVLCVLLCVLCVRVRVLCVSVWGVWAVCV